MKLTRKQKIAVQLNQSSKIKSESNSDEMIEFSFKQFFQKSWPMCLILIILVGIAYANSLNNAFVSDDLGIYQIKNLGTLKFIFSTPFHFMIHLFYSLAYHIGGYTPLFYRLSNIIFHLGSVIAIYILFALSARNFLGFIIATLFVVHPILVESVAWIGGAQYVQYGFFCLWSLIAYIIYRKKQNQKIFYFLLAFILYALALLSSEKAVVFPLILFLYELSFGDIKKHWKFILVFFFMALTPALIYVSQVSERMDSLAGISHQTKTIMNPLIQIPIAVSSYIQLIFWPDRLSLYQSEMTFSIAEYVWRLVIFMVYIGTTIYCFIKHKKHFFWLSFLMVSLIPTLTPFGVSWIVAERYVYLGTVGVLYGVGLILKKMIDNKKTSAIGYLLFMTIVLSLLVRTIIRNLDWKNEDTLWIATGKTSPSDPKTHNNLGDVYSRQGNLEKSAEEFKIAIRLQPSYADAYHNLGNTYTYMGKAEKATENYLQAIQYNSKLWQSHQNLAIIYFNQKKYDLAEKSLKRAIEINQGNADLHASLGVVYKQMGKKSLAQQSFTDALRVDPENAMAKKQMKK